MDGEKTVLLSGKAEEKTGRQMGCQAPTPGFRLAKRAGDGRFDAMFIAWTTVASRADAERLAGEIIARNLAVCVQIDGPVTAVYRWKGQIEHAGEFRLCLKFLPGQLTAISAWVQGNHPYEIPEWIVVPASEVGEKYLSWSGALPTNPPL
jgi:periplasmic divalent cation tolerance protein